MTIYVPIVMYGLRLFIVVLQELHCLPKFNMPIPWSLWISISTQVSCLNSVWLLRYLVEIEEEDNNIKEKTDEE